MQEDTLEETGWKLVHGDVFRPPKRAWLLTAFVGSGVQIFFMVLITLGKIILKEFVKWSMMFLWEIVVKLKSAGSYRWHRVNFHCVVSCCSVCHAWNVVTCQQRKPYDSNHISLCLHGVSVSIKIMSSCDKNFSTNLKVLDRFMVFLQNWPPTSQGDI